MSTTLLHESGGLRRFALALAKNDEAAEQLARLAREHEVTCAGLTAVWTYRDATLGDLAQTPCSTRTSRSPSKPRCFHWSETSPPALIERYADLPLGAADASVIAVADRVGIKTVLTLDHRHFRIVRPRHVGSLQLLP